MDNGEQAQGYYIAENGFKHCTTCNKPLEKDIKVGNSSYRVGVACQCVISRREAHEQQEKQEAIDRARMVCFKGADMKHWNFEKDDKSDLKMSNAMKSYAKDFSEYLKNGKGLLLYGDVGTGKTFFAACICNYLLDRGYRVLMTNFATLANELQGMYEGKQEYINHLNYYSLLVIDDLGAERKSEYMQEIVFNIIDSRYRSGKPLIITSNLTGEQLKNPENVGFARIYDRVMEMCHPVEIKGVSRRKKKLVNEFTHINERLGL